jgi:hypothetical protein
MGLRELKVMLEVRDFFIAWRKLGIETSSGIGAAS